ncbi:hypothetical protein HYV82_01170 [Candidatus Woesearchaeota archaeon]|nr:hypothetical protein [Candidatus Woesearchaeota archaeon]
MIDSKDFSGMRKEMEALDAKREKSIALSREIIRLSKRVIYSVHRDGLKEAEKLLDELKASVKRLESVGYTEEGHFRTAMQEYVEAACLFSVVRESALPRRASLGVCAEHYLLGICDLSGELVRRAINAATKGNSKEALFIKGFLQEIYGELLRFDYRNGELRRKFDGIKYDLQKLESLAFELSRRK